ncbi:DNA-binding protein [Hymenobacter sp. J193]|uniref:PPC domain-containing DNA-binding protein n=1 Tax=Hymenobacter sp. J193 TaxID=2898429 RepID=UPI002151B512|nr:PPC domain-containing DNA-binding protein [Hymenobacter sp. J193]MCR5888636.1 DNA-binding protein [Hymenobacter sp. J193]
MSCFSAQPWGWLLVALLSGPAAYAQSSSPAAMPTPASLAPASTLRTYALRLRPGDDLRRELQRFVEQHQLRAAAVLTCVGSLTEVSLRLANQSGPSTYHGHFEIVSLVGTLALSGSHLHLAVADSTGRMLGGIYWKETACIPPPSWSLGSCRNWSSAAKLTRFPPIRN